MLDICYELVVAAQICIGNVSSLNSPGQASPNHCNCEIVVTGSAPAK